MLSFYLIDTYFPVVLAIHYHFNPASETEMIWSYTAVPTSTCLFPVHFYSLDSSSRYQNKVIVYQPFFIAIVFWSWTLNSSFLFLSLLSLAASSRIGKCLQGKSSSKHKTYLPGFPSALHPDSVILHSLVNSSIYSRRFLSILSSCSSCPPWKYWSKLYSISLTQMEILCLLLKN